MGIGMRLSLYDAAFAVLVNIGGATARKSIAQVTLLGGLASVVFGPLERGCSTCSVGDGGWLLLPVRLDQHCALYFLAGWQGNT
ncbi:hypothetical protein M5585_00655 [Serratia ureilytica]